MLHKKRRWYFTSKSKHEILFRFHREFLLLPDRIKKIELLKKFSKKSMRDGKHRPATRIAFDKIKNYLYKINKKTCICCEAKAEVRHHVIPIMRGGDNFSKNITYLCNNCHAEIHEWLKPIPVDYLTEEFKNVINN